MSDRFGWDPDLYNGTGGNNMAIQLVMDGMKLQTCNPGFIDGRDAILAADIANNGGANQCLIWEVFARRGIGFSADQGTANTRHDVIEGFDLLPSCIQTVKIEKTSTPIVNAGEEFTVEIVVTNDKPETVTNVNITDELPEGTTLVDGSLSSSVAPSVSLSVSLKMVRKILNFGFLKMWTVQIFGNYKMLLLTQENLPGMFLIVIKIVNTSYC